MCLSSGILIGGTWRREAFIHLRGHKVLQLQGTGQLGSAVQLLTVLAVFILVIVLAYFATKWVAGYQKTKMTGTNIEVLESYRVAPAKFIAIVRVGVKYLAVSVGKDEMSLLCELTKDELVIVSPEEHKGTNFSLLLDKFKVAQEEKTPKKNSSRGEKSE